MVLKCQVLCKSETVGSFFCDVSGCKDRIATWIDNFAPADGSFASQQLDKQTGLNQC